MQTLSQVDVYFVSRELDALAGARVDQVYQYPDGRVRLKLRHESRGVRHVVIDAGRLVFESEWVDEPPSSPPAFAANLRKYLENAKLLSVRQVGFDKALRFEFSKTKLSGEQDLELAVELFGKGNVILLEGGTRHALAVLRTERGEKRTVAPKAAYALVPNQRRHFRDFFANQLKRELQSTPLDKALFAISDLPRDAARVALTRAGIDANQNPGSIGPVQWETLERVLKELLERPAPRLITGGENGPRFSSFETALDEDENEIVFTTLSETLDAFDRAYREWVQTHPTAAAKAPLAGVKQSETPKSVLEANKLHAALRQQQEALTHLMHEEQTARNAGEWIYQNYAKVEQAIAELKASGKKKMEIDAAS